MPFYTPASLGGLSAGLGGPGGQDVATESGTLNESQTGGSSLRYSLMEPFAVAEEAAQQITSCTQMAGGNMRKAIEQAKSRLHSYASYAEGLVPDSSDSDSDQETGYTIL